VPNSNTRTQVYTTADVKVQAVVSILGPKSLKLSNFFRYPEPSRSDRLPDLIIRANAWRTYFATMTKAICVIPGREIAIACVLTEMVSGAAYC
jgi:hypothetical protein